ncbi:MAG: leucine-rich repeat protein [Lachnospiraceae bacterium]|nr:leucine-rich repeat protein [Lachnospiraceae bacterium]
MGKNRKKTGSLVGFILTLAMMVVMCMPVQAKAATIAEATKTFTDEARFTIDATTGIITAYADADINNPATEIVVPATIGGVPVTGLSGTFNGNTAITTVILPNTITTLGDYTFNGCTSLSRVALYDIAAPMASTSEISDWEKNNYIYDLVGTKGYSIIGNDSCITLPATLTTLGVQTFGGALRNSSFAVMEGNTTFKTTEDGICLLSFDGKNIYRFAPNLNCNNPYYLPEGLETIGSYSFEESMMNNALYFPSSLQIISDYGFYKYDFVDNNFYFPENCQLHTIGSYAFTYNRKLQITLPKSVTTIGSYVFSYSENVAIDISKTQIVTIPAYAFADCSALHTLTLPETVLYIEAYAFANCNNLSTVTFLGDELLTLGEGAFKDSPTLHYITIPEGVTNIENDTFSGCGNLGEVVLPDSVEKIGDNAFKDCVTIHTLVIPPNVEYISNTSFDGVTQTNIDTSKNEYAQTVVKGELLKKGEKKQVGNLWYKVTKSHETNGTVTVLNAKNKKQKNIVIPATVNINGYTFKVTAINSKAFYNNKKLKSVTIGANVKTIGKKAFMNCKKLNKITVQSKVVTSVKSQAFKNINKKAKITLPKMTNKKFKKYKKKFMNKGQAGTVKIVKGKK